MSWFVCILRCRDGSLYTGHTNDIDARIAAHNAGRGAKYNASRRPVAPVFQETAESKNAALKRKKAQNGFYTETRSPHDCRFDPVDCLFAGAGKGV
jgi:putative endonuclease